MVNDNRFMQTAFDHAEDQGGIDSFADPLDIRAMEVSFKDKQICFVIPAGSKVDAYSLDLPGGMLVLGALRGKVNCASGSIIIAAGGEFQGAAEADDIYIEGRVTSVAGAQGGDLSRLKARGRASLADGGVARVTGGLIAVSASANILAHLQARFFHIPRHADLKRSVMETL